MPKVGHFCHLLDGFSIYCNIAFGTDCFLLDTIILLFLTFISTPYSFPFTFISVTRCCKPVAHDVNRAVSSAYQLLSMVDPPTTTPFISSLSLKILSIYKLNKLDDSTHPCRTPFLIINSLANLFSVRTTTVCF